MRTVYLAAVAAVMAFAATPAVAGECCWGGPVAIAVPPTGYVLDPSDARRPVYWVDQGGVYPGPWFYRSDLPTYSEGGYAFPVEAYPYDEPYPYVRSYGGDYWFSAPRRFGLRRPVYGSRSSDGPRIVRAGVGYGHVTPPYRAYDYRTAPSAKVITVPQQHTTMQQHMRTMTQGTIYRQ